jgi:hypothetical protein
MLWAQTYEREPRVAFACRIPHFQQSALFTPDTSATTSNLHTFISDFRAFFHFCVEGILIELKDVERVFSCNGH